MCFLAGLTECMLVEGSAAHRATRRYSVGYAGSWGGGVNNLQCQMMWA